MTSPASETDRAFAASGERPPEEPLACQSVFSLLLEDEYLLLIAALTLLVNWVNSNVEYILDRTLLAAAAHGGSRIDAMTIIAKPSLVTR